MTAPLPVEPSAPAPAPVRAARQPRKETAKRVSRQQGAIPPPPDGYSKDRKPLQVFLPGEEHWNLKTQALFAGTDMSEIIAAMVAAFNADPQKWLQLIRRAEDLRVPIGDLLDQALDDALEREIEPE